MAGAFSKILSYLGLIKDTSKSVKAFAPEYSSPRTASASPKAPRANHGTSLTSNQKANEGAHMNTFNMVLNKDLPPADKSSLPNKVAPTGFRVRVSMPARHEPFAPVVVECTPGSGGVQGLQWYSEKLMMDEDGDVAQEFLDEVVLHASGPYLEYTRTLPSFKMKMKTKPARLKGPVGTYDGNVVQPVLI